MTGIKHMEQAAVLTLKEQVAYQKGQVVSKTLAQNAALSVTLFSFDKGEEISTHESGGDAFVTCLDGMGRITIDGVRYELHEGESIVMPARHPHAVFGQEQFKMLLVVVFKSKKPPGWAAFVYIKFCRSRVLKRFDLPAVLTDHGAEERDLLFQLVDAALRGKVFHHSLLILKQKLEFRLEVRFHQG